MRIAIDAMGGDKAPAPNVEGAWMAAREIPEVEIVLVGDEPKLKELLKDKPGWESRISICHASEVIAMGESPVEALRKKRDASVIKTALLVRDKKAEAFISAGDTGASVACAALTLRLLEGVRKPGIAVTLPTTAGSATIIDVGANIYAKPHHLYQYAVMASIFEMARNRRERPRVGLLNIGEETEKGNDLVRQTHALLSKSHLNFVGNVEGKDFFKGVCDVLVCEGFVGNVILKLAEGLAETLISEFKNEVKKRFLSRLGAALVKPVLREFRNLTDYAQYGGAPLLGTDGISIICHGRSNARAILNAVKVALEMSRYQVNERIVAELKANGTPQVDVA